MMASESKWKHLNLLVILLAVCVLGTFVLRAKLETEAQWRLMPPSKGNLFVQHPLTWIAGGCYAHGTVLDALTEAAQSLQNTGVPIIVFALSNRVADAANTGWTADIGYVSTTPNGKFAQTSPALLSFGPYLHYDANGISEGIVTTTVDPSATLAVIRALLRQSHASVTSIRVAPFIMPMLQQAAHSMPAAERDQTVALLLEAQDENAFMHVTFSPTAHSPAADYDAAHDSGQAQPQ